MGLSAALLFAIQPMYAKMLLPLVGGAPAVWSTVVVFFQVGLLAGYVLAHLLRSFVPLRLQLVAHVGLAALAVAVLPFHVQAASLATTAQPAAFVLWTLLMGAGLPFLVISATSPLLQSWFSRLGHAGSGDPYFLYVASNAGSLLGLAAYPLILEPTFGVWLQTRIWAWGYVALLACLAVSASVTWRFASAPAAESLAEEPLAEEAPTTGRRIRWIALAFVPASLSLAMTTHITNEVAPLPLLWTLPLGIYLLTFIIAFSRRPLLTPERIARFLPYVILPLVLLLLLGSVLPTVFDVGLNLAALFLVAMTCHGELSASRPQARFLTMFYVLLSVGGALGGVFNALVAPYVFRTVAEYPLTLVLASAILPTLGTVGGTKRSQLVDVLAPSILGCGLLAVYALTLRTGDAAVWMRIAFALSMVACFAFVGRRLRLALGIGVLFLVASFVPGQAGYRLDAERNFFGTKLVVANAAGTLHEFVHSGTVHGIESTQAALRADPLAYYSRQGPLGAIFQVARTGSDRTERAGLVGLGVGTIACYRRPGERWTFFEIDPQVVAIAQRPALFAYLSLCAPASTIVVGDGRLELQKVSPGSYGLLVLDAYSSDQPPIHLLTREAFALYARDVAPGGLIAFHISNRYFNLVPVVENMASAAGWHAWLGTDSGMTPERRSKGDMESQWILVARSDADAGAVASDPRWRRLSPDPRVRPWTDDYSSLLTVMHS